MTEAQSGWKRARLDEIVERYVDRREDLDSFSSFVGVDDINSGDLVIRRHGTIDVDQLPPTFRYAFKRGMVLVPTRRPNLRKCAIAPFDGLTGEKVLVLAPLGRADVNPSLIPFILSSPAVQEWNISKQIGSVTPHFRWSDMAACKIALPPHEVQKSAATFFDCHLKNIESLRSAALAAARQERVILEQHFGNQSLSVSVFDVADSLSGGTPSRGESSYWNGAIPWLSPKDMKHDLLFDTLEHITTDAVASGCRIAPACATFVVVRGMILQHSFPVCRTTVPMAFNQDVKAFVPRESTLPEYLALWFRWAAPRLLRLVSETTHGTKRIEAEQLRKVPFPRVSQREQADFIDKHKLTQVAIAALKGRIEYMLSLRASVFGKLGLA